MKIKKVIIFSAMLLIVYMIGWYSPPGTEKNILQAFVHTFGANTPPKAPVINTITDKSFSVNGTAEHNAEVYVVKEGKHEKTINANSEGFFTFEMPLQAAGTEFEFYTKDADGNESLKTKLTVLNQDRPANKIISTPSISQMPELARGCEVTSLAMLLNYAGVDANKMTLADELKKDPTKLQFHNGKKYFGNPNFGYVGNMFTYKEPGFGVFNGPIAELANEYMPERIINLTGHPFDILLDYVGSGHPVWVIITSTFDHVSSRYWETWDTEQGPIKITMKEHSVLITGYDNDYVYFNDPVDGQQNKKVAMENFFMGWAQYGKQAISYY